MNAFALTLLLSASAAAEPRRDGLVERALAAFWSAEDDASRWSASQEILRSGGDFYAVYARLRSGRSYDADVDTGLVEESRSGPRGLRYEYVFLVPEDYDPEARYRVCVYLHGGAHRAEPWKKGDDWWRRFDRFDGVSQISVFPSSWRGAAWWAEGQIDNLEAILHRIKRDYNVDENRVYLYGVSDGGTGVYFQASKAPTIWAAFFAFIGHPGVLDNPATGAEGRMFRENLANKPLYVVSGEKDRLYPADQVRPFIETYREAGAEILFRTMPGGHNTRWWNAERPAIETFMEDHPREPYPERLVWETESADRFPRVHWLVVEELFDGAGSGWVDVRREGNVFIAATRGVRRFRLLLSPEQVDFERPVRVVTNAVASFEGRVEPSVRSLLRWASEDDDRTMLFAAELVVEVPNES